MDFIIYALAMIRRWAVIQARDTKTSARPARRYANIVPESLMRGA
jgi:hypothetical protein